MNDPNKTQFLSDPNRTMMATAPVADPNKTLMGTAPSLNATQTIKPVQCPVCKSFNPAGVMFCVDCGLIFDRALDGDAFGAPAVQLPVIIDESGKETPVRPGENIIGREGYVVINDSRVSRRHAVVKLFEDGSITLEDLGSTNGTKVNGQSVAGGSPVNLAGGEKISVGGYELGFQLPSSGSNLKTQQFASNKTASIAAPPRADNAEAYLIGEGMKFALKSGMNAFGRKPENEIQITDPYVSGKHGIIELAQDGYFITDIGSTNGTLLNEAKLVPNMRTAFGPSDEIRLGSLVLKLEPIGGAKA